MTTTFTLEEINKVAKEILATPSLKKVITFHATMGVGKTTLIKELVKELGVTGNSSSPTFSLVNEYLSDSGETIYHFDLYRINSEMEAYDMGIDEYFYSDNWWAGMDCRWCGAVCGMAGVDGVCVRRGG